MGETYDCLECKKETNIVIDYRSGDSICSECGLVLEDRSISEFAEWRTFADDNNDKDPNRVGGRINPIFDQANLVTQISHPKSAKKNSEQVLYSRKSTDLDRGSIERFEIIALMADRLGLVRTIKDRAYEIYKNVEEQKTCKGRKLDAVFAACLFIACRESKLSRTLKEFATVANGLKGKEINKAVELIKRQLELQMGSGKAEEFVRRFCSNLGMSSSCMMAVQEAVAKSEEFDVRRCPKSVLGAIIYMIAQLSDQKKSLKDVSVAAEVAELTIKKAYKDIYPYAARLIPSWFANAEDLKKLCSTF